MKNLLFLIELTHNNLCGVWPLRTEQLCKIKSFCDFYFFQSFCVYENNPELWPEDQELCEGLSSAIFSANDKDTSSELTIGIDWQKSQAYDRDNQKVPDVEFYDTFVMKQTGSNYNVTGELQVSSEKFIDYEKVARVDLSIYVLDKGINWSQWPQKQQ